MYIKGKNSEEVWKKVLKEVIGKGKDFIDRDTRVCRELLNVTLVVDSADSITKPIEIINSFGKWIYPSLEELEDIFMTKKDIPGYYYNYGARAFNHNGVNQIDDYVIPLLKKDGNTRRASVIFYNPEKDSSLFKKDIPSMILMNFNIRDDKLNASAVVRSNDLFFGWPANIYQIAVLQDYVAKAVGCSKGSLTTVSISAHIFEDQFEYIRKII